MSDRSPYTAIADPTRRRVLDLLRVEGELRAGEIAATFDGRTRPGISRHLRILRECGVVACRNQGRERTYSLNAAPLADLRDGWLADFARVHPDSLTRLRAKVERGRD